MQELNLLSIFFIGLSFSLVSGCALAGDDFSSLGCPSLKKTFFGKSTSSQISEFGKYSIEEQYAIFLCGNQEREPPAAYLATPFAQRGAAAVGFLKSKLVATSDDATIVDILRIVVEMNRQNTYNVASDIDLVTAMSESVGRVKDSGWKKICKRWLQEIEEKSARTGK